MTLEKLQTEMIAAMKSKNKSRKDTISSLIGAIKKTAIDKRCKDNITEELVNEVILKEKKTVQEMIDTCPANRTDLFFEYQERLNEMYSSSSNEKRRVKGNYVPIKLIDVNNSQLAKQHLGIFVTESDITTFFNNLHNANVNCEILVIPAPMIANSNL